MAVEHTEVGNDDGYGQRDGQDAGQGAQGADEHADVSFGHHVTVADRGHRHDGPPQAFGNTLRPIGVSVNLPAASSDISTVNMVVFISSHCLSFAALSPCRGPSPLIIHRLC